MPDYTTTALLASIRRRTGAPEAVAAGTANADLLAIATEELWGPVAAHLKAARSNFFLTSHTQAIVAGTAAYPIPPRAMGSGMAEVEVIQSDGSIRNLLTIDRTDLHTMDQTPGAPSHFYFQDDQVILFPTPSGSGETLRIPYYRRAGVLVLTSAVAVITAINTGTRVLTLASTIPATFLTTVTYDLIGARPGFRTLGMDLAVTNASGTSMTFTATLPTDLAVGDYVCLAGESPVAQIPPETHQLLAQHVAVKVLAGPSYDARSLDDARAELKRLKEDLGPSVEPRSEGELTTVGTEYFFGAG